MVHEKSTTGIFLSLRFFTFGVSETSVSAHHVLVDVDRLEGANLSLMSPPFFMGTGMARPAGDYCQRVLSALVEFVAGQHDPSVDAREV
jgi:hypothetical protein